MKSAPSMARMDINMSSKNSSPRRLFTPATVLVCPACNQNNPAGICNIVFHRDVMLKPCVFLRGQVHTALHQVDIMAQQWSTQDIPVHIEGQDSEYQLAGNHTTGKAMHTMKGTAIHVWGMAMKIKGHGRAS